jgi:hypothetical protein
METKASAVKKFDELCRPCWSAAGWRRMPWALARQIRLRHQDGDTATAVCPMRAGAVPGGPILPITMRVTDILTIFTPEGSIELDT